MANEYFSNSMNLLALQWHLLAVPTKTIADAVRTGGEVLQIKTEKKQTLGRLVRAVVEVKYSEAGI